MQKSFVIACSVLCVPLSIHAKQTDQRLLPLTYIHAHIAACEKLPLVNDLAHHFTEPFTQITTLPALDIPTTALVLVNATLVTLKNYDYPIDKLKVAHTSLVSVRSKEYPQTTLQTEQAALDFVRVAVQELDKICRAWHQHCGQPNRSDSSPQIPLINLIPDYALAVQQAESSLIVAQQAGHDATFIANNLQRYLRTLTLNKQSRKSNASA